MECVPERALLAGNGCGVNKNAAKAICAHLSASLSLRMRQVPAIPTLPLCWLACRWHRATFIVDWHNFAYTLMGLSMGPRHPLARPGLPCRLPCVLSTWQDAAKSSIAHLYLLATSNEPELPGDRRSWPRASWKRASLCKVHSGVLFTFS